MTKNPTIVFTAPKSVVIEDRDCPPLAANELLVQTRCSLISTGTELTLLEGGWDPNSVWGKYACYPQVPGYSTVGEVIETGPGADKRWLGRRVATCGNSGAHSTYVVSRAADTRSIEHEVLWEQASFFTIAEIVMNGVRRGQVQWGESAAVYGLGVLGQLAVRFCRLAGARPVFAIDVAERRLQCLPRDPAVIAINPRTDDPAAVIGKATRGRMADVVFEVTGSETAIPGEFAVLRRQGRFVLLSSPRGKTLFDFHDLCNSPSFTIIGAHNSSHPAAETPDNPWTCHRHAQLFFDLLADGELDLAPLVSHAVPYTQAPEIYRMLLADRSQAMGVVLRWA